MTWASDHLRPRDFFMWGAAPLLCGAAILGLWAPVDAAAKVGIFTTAVGALTTLAGYYLGVRAADRSIERAGELAEAYAWASDEAVRGQQRLAEQIARAREVIDVSAGVEDGGQP